MCSNCQWPDAGVDMPGYELDGGSGVICAWRFRAATIPFSSTKPCAKIISTMTTSRQDPIFNIRINSLIDIFFQKGRLIELCGALAAERKDNEAVHLRSFAYSIG